MSEKQKRVVIYMNAGRHKRLKAALALLGKTVSGWFRQAVKDLLEE